MSACLCWVLVKIPGWVSRIVFSGSRGHGGIGRVVRDVVVYKGVKALAAGVGAVSRRDDRDDRGRVRIPADVERDDRLLAGLTARQLAILAVAGVVLWAGYAATRHLVPSAAFGAVAVPFGAVAAMLALGRFEGVAADRWVAAAWRHHRSPHRLVPAPDGVPAAPAFLGAERRARCPRRCASRWPGSAPTGSSTSVPTGWPSSAGPAR